MAVMANRRSVMTLFSDPTCAYSHQTRMVLMEKGITVDIISIDPDNKPEDLLDLNPYNTVPTLVDRDLMLYNAHIIMEYLDERFPHPPLMPVDPVSRARARLALYRIDEDWFRLLDEIESKTEKQSAKERKALRESLISSAELFAAKPFFLSDEFSLMDCAIAPLLWRLPHLGIELPAQAKAVIDYADRIFARESFQESLTEGEREMRE
ncbi:stringent starvation protein A [Solemya pervernicosa gill symbiont]|uniref:Stringent starvation protein A n=2 Tax=Gammaproteobacteria incertae sedis TaxID=118884 RepID=A0A1T2L9U8_9GAMM|nr:stringent starvation protein SspA [Candidatus Reidiella endopervernicosa]OOZ41863.1 stringent starvation protein A [Solemya pervernicosa gill symbiont]QKQ26182.1 glutathione S-transferase N-terminal domain-containing protein [Candidatus Reidiella endopervernicosa]